MVEIDVIAFLRIEFERTKYQKYFTYFADTGHPKIAEQVSSLKNKDLA